MGIVVSMRRQVNEAEKLQSGVLYPPPHTDADTLEQSSWSFLKALERITSSDAKGKCFLGKSLLVFADELPGFKSQLCHFLALCS
jgi:hypothetical protein